VVFLLDTLADRLGPVAAAKGVRLIQTVLGNVTKGDPKYLRLRAGNQKLWAGLVQHPELCMVLEAAGFRKSTEEQDRCIELGQLELSVQELLKMDEKIDETKSMYSLGQLEVLLHRMEELKRTPISSAPSGGMDDTAARQMIAWGFDDDALVGRTSTFLHPADEMSLGDLAIVLEAVAEWTPLSTEEACQELHISHSSATTVIPPPSNEATEASTHP